MNKFSKFIKFALSGFDTEKMLAKAARQGHEAYAELLHDTGLNPWHQCGNHLAKISSTEQFSDCLDDALCAALPSTNQLDVFLSDVMLLSDTPEAKQGKLIEVLSHISLSSQMRPSLMANVVHELNKVYQSHTPVPVAALWSLRSYYKTANHAVPSQLSDLTTKTMADYINQMDERPGLNFFDTTKPYWVTENYITATYEIARLCEPSDKYFPQYVQRNFADRDLSSRKLYQHPMAWVMVSAFGAQAFTETHNQYFFARALAYPENQPIQPLKDKVIVDIAHYHPHFVTTAIVQDALDNNQRLALDLLQTPGVKLSHDESRALRQEIEENFYPEDASPLHLAVKTICPEAYEDTITTEHHVNGGRFSTTYTPRHLGGPATTFTHLEGNPTAVVDAIRTHAKQGELAAVLTALANDKAQNPNKTLGKPAAPDTTVSGDNWAPT